jgi:hypothetical protein
MWMQRLQAENCGGLGNWARTVPLQIYSKRRRDGALLLRLRGRLACVVFVWLIRHQPVVLFSQNKSASAIRHSNTLLIVGSIAVFSLYREEPSRIAAAGLSCFFHYESIYSHLVEQNRNSERVLFLPQKNVSGRCQMD